MKERLVRPSKWVVLAVVLGTGIAALVAGWRYARRAAAQNPEVHGRRLDDWIADAKQTADQERRREAVEVLVAVSTGPQRECRWKVLKVLFQADKNKTVPGLFVEMKDEHDAWQAALARKPEEDGPASLPAQAILVQAADYDSLKKHPRF